MVGVLPSNGALGNHGYKALLIKPQLQSVMPWRGFSVGGGPRRGVSVKVTCQKVGDAVINGGKEERVEEGGGGGGIMVEVDKAQGLGRRCVWKTVGAVRDGGDLRSSKGSIGHDSTSSSHSHNSAPGFPGPPWWGDIGGTPVS